MAQSHIQCVIFITFIFFIISLDVTYDVTYNTLGKLFGISESQWKPAAGGSQLDCVGFWVHLVVFAIIIYSRYYLRKIIERS
jgi:hypothetical protein